MKQIFQNLSNGKSELIDAPAPKPRSGNVLIDTTVSLISTGTERMLVDFGKAGLVSKARQQPEKVQQVLEKVKTDGVLTTLDAVRSKLAQPLPLGYCNVGVVKEAPGTDFKIGDRVVSNGHHADVVNVPQNLCAKIPDTVSDEAAVFAVVASIGLQGIRLANPTLGEAFVVTGVGLIGLLTVQMLRAHGCRVLAIDFDSEKLALAQSFGAETCNPANGEDPIAAGLAFSRGVGVDGVIVTASTKSNDPMTQAARMCRKRARIILVGVTGLELNRADFYEKEISFQVSCSYGPGRYDPEYETKGTDYPIGFVRWTEKRNFEAVLDMLADGSINIQPLISYRVDFEKAEEAYDILSNDKKALGILLQYTHSPEIRHVDRIEIENHKKQQNDSDVVVGFIGAGNYASRALIPAFKSAGVELHTLVSSTGSSSAIVGRKSGFSTASSDTEGMLKNPEINCVAIVTQHDSHAPLSIDALNAGKHVFVEKPLALTLEQLEQLEAAHQTSGRHLMVGFNRRFAPQVQTMKRLLDAKSTPKSFIMVMNAGSIPANHWTQDINKGGGRIVGEACHYIDLMRFLANSPISSVQTQRMGKNGTVEIVDDKASITLGFKDGSFGTIHYLANGGASLPKERIEVFADGGTLQLDNFLRLRGYNWRGFSKQNLLRQDKGQKKCTEAFVNAIQGKSDAPIEPDELFEVARISIKAAELIRSQNN